MSKADQSDVDHLMQRDERSENKFRLAVVKYIQELLVGLSYLVKMVGEVEGINQEQNDLKE